MFISLFLIEPIENLIADILHPSYLAYDDIDVNLGKSGNKA